MEIYQDNVRKYMTATLSLDKDLKGLSVFRLVAFAFSTIIITILANERLLIPMLMIISICIVGWILLIKRFNEFEYLLQQNIFLKEINEQEILRLENKLSRFSTGQAFINHDHSYTSDLDIFDQHSLFQMINRTTTEPGQVLLAEWLSAPATKEVILERQKAIEELSSRVEWRQHFQASGMHFRHAKSDFDKLLNWIEKPVHLLPRQSAYLIIAIVLSIFSTSAAIYFFSHLLSVASAEELVPYLIPLIITLLINSLLLRKVRSIAEEISDNIHHHIRILGGFQALVSEIESEKFHSERLQQLQAFFLRENLPVSGEIKRLKQLLEVFKLRGGKRQFNHFFYSIANALWFLDVYLIIRIEKWKNKHGLNLKNWVATTSEFEVLASLAGLHYSNPSFAFPKIRDDSAGIYFKDVGHPLISAQKRVYNHFRLNASGEIAMITGSNMAGKSTFLRTIGINLVLALMGAPCCAAAAEVSNVKIFSSMRTQDNLEEGVSSFYAELKRIEQLLKLIESGQPLFFLLDEMFKGTNSKDRNKGGFSLIKQLKELNAFGIISTHNLDLASLAGKYGLVTNYSFNSNIQKGEMLFNYVLTGGLCSDFNASELMKRSGIKILPHIDGYYN